MPVPAVPTGVVAPVTLQIPIVCSTNSVLPPVVPPSLMPLRPIYDTDMTKVTAVSLAINYPDGTTGTLTAAMPASATYLTWAASTAFAANAYAVPSPASGYFYKCTTAGTTGATSPVFPTVVGATVTDGTAVWTCMGAATTQTSLTASYAFTGSDTAKLGTWQIEATLTPGGGGSIPCHAGQLTVTPANAP